MDQRNKVMLPQVVRRLEEVLSWYDSSARVAIGRLLVARPAIRSDTSNRDRHFGHQTLLGGGAGIVVSRAGLAPSRAPSHLLYANTSTDSLRGYALLCDTRQG